MTYGGAQPSINRVLASDFSRWPARIKEWAAGPLTEETLTCRELENFLDGSEKADLRWSNLAPDGPSFPKIGVCSWKEWPWLLPYYGNSLIELSRHCSDRMRIVLSAWVEAERPIHLRFFPYDDHSQANEYRFLTRSRTIVRSVVRNQHDGVPAARAIFDACVESLDDCIIDIATRREDHGIRAWVVELNPVVGRDQDEW